MSAVGRELCASCFGRHAYLVLSIDWRISLLRFSEVRLCSSPSQRLFTPPSASVSVRRVLWSVRVTTTVDI